MLVTKLVASHKEEKESMEEDFNKQLAESESNIKQLKQQIETLQNEVDHTTKERTQERTLRIKLEGELSHNV